MQYTCWPITKTFTSANTTRHLAHTEPMIEKWRLDSDGFMSPFLPPSFFLSLPRRVIQSTLHLFLMNWASMFGVPHPHRLHSHFPEPSPFILLEVDPTTLLHSWLSRISQGSVPCLSSSLWLSLHLPLRRHSERPPTCLNVHADVTQTNQYKEETYDGFFCFLHKQKAWQDSGAYINMPTVSACKHAISKNMKPTEQSILFNNAGA